MSSLKSLTITKLLNEQKKLQGAMGQPMGYGHVAVKENVLATIVELVEVLAEIPWKPWKRYDQPPESQIDREALLTEMTDVLQFWANMVNSMGFTADDVASAIQKKWQENYRRLGTKAS